MKTDLVELVLTCGSWQEAQAIADVVLEKGLVAKVEFMEVAKEIKLVMESLATNFEKIETEVARLHSYDNFVLQQVPRSHLSSQAAETN